ncbi:hypothetical protein [Citrobacter youngae]|nr:hypothetical protein [Citrobacter youngae]
MHKCCLMASVMLMGVAHAALPPPEIPDEMVMTPTTTLVLPSGVMLGNYFPRFEDTTLSQVQQAIGVNSGIAHQGDAGGSIYWLCYTIPVKHGGQHLWLIASGEMGGLEHDITEVTVQSANGTAPTSDCPALPSRFQPVRLDNSPVWPGVSRAKAVLSTGGGNQNGNWLFLSSEKWVPPGSCEEAAQENSMYIHTVFGHVDIVDAGQITAC